MERRERRKEAHEGSAGEDAGFKLGVAWETSMLAVLSPSVSACRPGSLTFASHQLHDPSLAQQRSAAQRSLAWHLRSLLAFRPVLLVAYLPSPNAPNA